MTLPAVGDAQYPTPDELRSAYLRTVRLGFARRGLAANVLPGSDHYIRGDALAKRLSIALANNRVAREQLSVLTATGDQLVKEAGVYGVTKRPAAAAAGYVAIVCTGTITIPSGFRATGPNGLKYDTTSTNAGITTGALVQLRCVTAGAAGDLEVADQVSWDSAAIGALNSVATVAAGGIDGGADEDDEETLRRRLLDRLSFPSVGGNVGQVRGWAEESSASVDQAFCYAAVRGPGSYDVAVTGSSGDGILTSATLNAIAAYIQGKMPGIVSLNVTSAQNQEVDVVLAGSLALPVQAGGAGGGWLDADPWPVEAVQITGFSQVTGDVTVTATTAPNIGRRIAVWDPTGGDDSEGLLREYTVTAPIAVVAGGFTFRVTSASGIAGLVGAYVSAGAVNLAAYCAAAKAAIQALGPGEKSDSTDVIPRGRRYPGPDVTAPSGLSSRVIDAIEQDSPEILSMVYALRVETGTLVNITEPSLPASTADPPKRLRLKYFAIYKE